LFKRSTRSYAKPNKLRQLPAVKFNVGIHNAQTSANINPLPEASHFDCTNINMHPLAKREKLHKPEKQIINIRDIWMNDMAKQD